MYLLLSVPFYNLAQYSELKEYGYKGSVKSCTTRIYAAWDENQVPDTTAGFYRTYRHFNQNGMVDYFGSFYSYYAEGKSQMMAHVSNISFSIDSITGLKNIGIGISTNYAGDSITKVTNEKYTFHWVDSYHYYERCYDATLETKKSEQYIELDSTFFIIYVQYTSFSEIIPDYSSSSRVTKNENGQIGQTAEMSSYEEAVIQTSDYKTFDAAGNPTLIIVSTLKEDGVDQLLMVKTYEYY